MVTEQPSIFIYGLRLDEPVTTITDLIFSAVCFYAYFRLTKLAERQILHQYLRSNRHANLFHPGWEELYHG